MRLRAGSWRGGRVTAGERAGAARQCSGPRGLKDRDWLLGSGAWGRESWVPRVASWREPPPATDGAVRLGPRGLAFAPVPLPSQGHRSHGLGRTLMTSCNLDYLFGGRVSRTGSHIVGQGVTARMPREHNSASDTGQGWWHQKLVSIMEREWSPGAGYYCFPRRDRTGGPLGA